jgi:hypothetical protein
MKMATRPPRTEASHASRCLSTMKSSCTPTSTDESPVYIEAYCAHNLVLLDNHKLTKPTTISVLQWPQAA